MKSGKYNICLSVHKNCLVINQQFTAFNKRVKDITNATKSFRLIGSTKKTCD